MKALLVVVICLLFILGAELIWVNERVNSLTTVETSNRVCGRGACADYCIK